MLSPFPFAVIASGLCKNDGGAILQRWKYVGDKIGNRTKSKAVHMECSDNKTFNRKYSQRTISLNTKIQKNEWTMQLCIHIRV
jgi:hypothetical protein